MLQNEPNSPSHNDPGRDLFEACRNGDLNKVKKLVNHHNVNAKDTAGRKSTPLHFAAGLSPLGLVLLFILGRLKPNKFSPINLDSVLFVVKY